MRRIAVGIGTHDITSSSSVASYESIFHLKLEHFTMLSCSFEWNLFFDFKIWNRRIKGRKEKYTQNMSCTLHTHTERQLSRFTFDFWENLRVFWVSCCCGFHSTLSPSLFCYFCRSKCKAQHLIGFLFVFVVVRSQESPFLLHSHLFVVVFVFFYWNLLMCQCCLLLIPTFNIRPLALLVSASFLFFVTFRTLHLVSFGLVNANHHNLYVEYVCVCATM